MGFLLRRSANWRRIKMHATRPSNFDARPPSSLDGFGRNMVRMRTAIEPTRVEASRFPSPVRRRSKPVALGEWLDLRRSSGRRSDSRCLEANCVPQRARNGSARGTRETRDAGEFELRRAVAAPRNACETRGMGAPIRANSRIPNAKASVQCIRSDLVDVGGREIHACAILLFKA